MNGTRIFLRASMIGFLLVGVAGMAAGQLAASKKDYSDEEFAEQWDEVQKKFPLVAQGFSFLQNLSKFCNVDEACFRTLQDNCLRQGLPPRFCLEESRRACCKPLVVQPTPPAEPPRLIDVSGVKVLDPGRGGSSSECNPAERPRDIGCSRICKPCVTFVCIDGEWEPLRMDFPDGLCDPRPPLDPPITACPRSSTGFCPAECSVCF